MNNQQVKEENKANIVRVEGKYGYHWECENCGTWIEEPNEAYFCDCCGRKLVF